MKVAYKVVKLWTVFHMLMKGLIAMRGSCSKDEEKKAQLLYIKVQAKKTKIDALFDLGS